MGTNLTKELGHFFYFHRGNMNERGRGLLNRNEQGVANRGGKGTISRGDDD